MASSCGSEGSDDVVEGYAEQLSRHAPSPPRGMGHARSDAEATTARESPRRFNEEFIDPQNTAIRSIRTKVDENNPGPMSYFHHRSRAVRSDSSNKNLHIFYT